MLAGSIALVGAVRKDGRWPANGVQGVIATAVLVLIASATNGTKIGPLVRAFGIMLLLSSGYAAIRANAGKLPARATPADTPAPVYAQTGIGANVTTPDNQTATAGKA